MPRFTTPRTALPPPPFLFPLLARTAIYWLAVRAFLYFFWGHILFEDPVYAFAVTMTVLIAIRTDIWAFRQQPFLENLGVGTVGMLRTAATALVVVEVIAFVITRSGTR